MLCLLTGQTLSERQQAAVEAHALRRPRPATTFSLCALAFTTADMCLLTQGPCTPDMFVVQCLIFTARVGRSLGSRSADDQSMVDAVACANLGLSTTHSGHTLEVKTWLL